MNEERSKKSDEQRFKEAIQHIDETLEKIRKDKEEFLKYSLERDYKLREKIKRCSDTLKMLRGY